MVGVLIYKSRIMKSYYNLVISDNSIYSDMRKNLVNNNSNRILWEKSNVSLNQIENSRNTKDDLVRRLNDGENVDLEKELEEFFE